MTGHDVVDLAKKFEDYGVEALIYTDIGRDGMMSGVNIEATFKLAQAIKTPVIASRRPEQPGGRAGALRQAGARGHHRRDRRPRALRGQARLEEGARPPPTRRPRKPDVGLAKRVIPCLDVTAGRVVKGVKFVELRDAGDPVEIAARYDGEGADELTFLDITASSDERDILLHVIEAVASKVFIPLTVGGGVRKVEDVRRLLNAGADKVSINTAAVTESRSWCARPPASSAPSASWSPSTPRRSGDSLGSVHPRRAQAHRARRREWAKRMAAGGRGRDPAHQHGPRRHARRLRPRR